MSTQPRTRKPVFPLRVDPYDTHRIVDSHPRGSRLVDTYVSTADAAWVVERCNAVWRAEEAAKAARLAAEAKAREEAASIPEVRPNKP